MATGEIIGKVNIPTKTALYEGKETDTANVLVDNVDKTIAVNVKVGEVTKDCAKSIESTQDENTVELSLKNDADEVISSTTFNVESSPIIDSKNVTEYDDASLKKLYRDIPEEDEDVKDSIYYINKEYVHYTREVHVNDEITNFGTGTELKSSQIFQCLGGDVDTLINSVINVSTQEEQIPFKVFPQYIPGQEPQEEIWSGINIEDMVEGDTYRLKEINTSSLVSNLIYGPSSSDFYFDLTPVSFVDNETGQIITYTINYIRFSKKENGYGFEVGDDASVFIERDFSYDADAYTIKQFEFIYQGNNSFVYMDHTNHIFEYKIQEYQPGYPASDLSFKLGASKAKGVLGFELKPGISKVTLGVKVWGSDATPSIIVNGNEIAINSESDAIQEIEVNLTDNKLVLETIVMSGKAKRFTLHYIKQTLQGDAVYTKQYLGQGGGSSASLEMPTISMSSITTDYHQTYKLGMFNPLYYPDIESKLHLTIKLSNTDALQVGDEIQLCRYVLKQPNNNDNIKDIKARYRYRRITGYILTDKDIENIKKTNTFTLSIDYETFVSKIYNRYDSKIPQETSLKNYYLSLARDNLYMRVLRRIDDNTGQVDDHGFKSSGKSLSVSCKLPAIVIDGKRNIADFPDAETFTEFTIRTQKILFSNVKAPKQ